METVAIALIAAVVGPLVLAWTTNYMRREEKQQDWERQDKVAAAALKAAADMTEAARGTKEAVDRTDRKLDVIHKLGNSAYTVQLKLHLESMKRELALLEEIHAGNTLQNRPSSATTLAAIESTKVRIADLELEIADRERNAEASDPEGVLATTPLTQAKQTVTEAVATVDALKPEEAGN